MLYVTMGALENCAAYKKKIQTVCPEIWIHYIVGGAGFYNGERLSEGQGFIMYKDTLCEYYPDRRTPWSYVWIRLEGKDAEGLLQKCGFPASSGIFSFDYARRLTELVPTLFPYAVPIEEGLLYREAIARLILSLHASRGKEQPSREEAQVQRAKEYMAATLSRGIGIEEIADALSIDRKYLRNLFVKHTGACTMEYLQNLRTSRAKELLLKGELTVSAVARSIGFEDPLTFSRFFKKRVGISPSAYREQSKNEGEHHPPLEHDLPESKSQIVCDYIL